MNYYDVYVYVYCEYNEYVYVYSEYNVKTLQ